MKKRCIAILCSVLCILSVSAFPVGAYDDIPGEYKVSEWTQREISKGCFLEDSSNCASDDILYEERLPCYRFYRLTKNDTGYFIIYYDGFRTLLGGPPRDGQKEYVLGDYIIERYNGYRMLYYIPKEGKSYSIDLAYEAGVFGAEELAELCEASKAIAQINNFDIQYAFRVYDIKELTPGNMNTDGELTVADVVVLRKIILRASWRWWKLDLYEGDMNQDGEITVTDVVLLRKAILANES